MVYEIEFPKTDFLFLLLQDKNILKSTEGRSYVSRDQRQAPMI